LPDDPQNDLAPTEELQLEAEKPAASTRPKGTAKSKKPTIKGKDKAAKAQKQRRSKAENDEQMTLGFENREPSPKPAGKKHGAKKAKK